MMNLILLLIILLYFMTSFFESYDSGDDESVHGFEDEWSSTLGFRRSATNPVWTAVMYRHMKEKKVGVL